jgi:sigma-E factor negative regulatory protein RseC
VFRAENQINAQAGDMVVVGVDEKALLAGSLAVYGVPLFMLLAGAAVGGMFAPAQGSADGWTLAGAGSGLVLGLFWLRLHAAGSGLDGRYRTVLLRPAASDAHRPCHRGK